MKTQILQLEAHDDINSTRDKLGWGQTGRVVLVWPKLVVRLAPAYMPLQRGSGANGAKVLNHRLDLVLLQRHSASLGLQIALVTRDAEVRYHAQQLRIPVFDSVDEAQRAHWRSRRRRAIPVPSQYEKQKRLELVTPRLNAPRASHKEAKALHPAIRWGLFSLAILSLLVLAASILPEAHITLHPETRPQEIAFNITASPVNAAYMPQKPNLSGEVPAQVTSVIVEGRSSLPTTGKVQVPEKAAAVRVRFTNLTEEPVDIPQGLVVSTVISTVPQAGQAAIRFLTSEAGRVPGGVGEFISLPVRALTPGRSGNLPAGSLAAIEGPLGLRLSVTNLLPTSGGSDLPASGPAPADYTRLNDELVEALRQDALSDLLESLGPGDLAITPTLKLVETLEKTYDPPQPELPAAQLRLFIRLKFDALVIPGADLRSISARILDANLPEGYTPIPDSLEITPSGFPTIDSIAGEGAQGASTPVARWRVAAQRTIGARIDPDQVAGLTRGLAASQAEQFLKAWLPLGGPPVVTITPAWWPRLPLLTTRISIEIPDWQETRP